MPRPTVNILVSFAYWNDKIEKELSSLPKGAVRLLVDCGAFSKHSSGKEISFDSYCAFLANGLPDCVWKYASFDSVFDGPKTHANFLKMKERGLSPTPVFTRGQGKEQLREYVKTEGYALLGGIATRQARNYLVTLLQENKDIAQNVHLFGVANNLVLKRFKVGSCDVSTWVYAAKMGALTCYMGNGQLMFYALGNLPKVSPKIVRLCEIHGITKKEFYAPSDWNASRRQQIGARAHIMRATAFERKQGTKIFLVASNVAALRLILSEAKWLSQTGALSYV